MERKEKQKMNGFEFFFSTLIWWYTMKSNKFIRIPNSVWRKLDHLHFLYSLDGKLVCSHVGLALINCLILHAHIHWCQLSLKTWFTNAIAPFADEKEQKNNNPSYWPNKTKRKPFECIETRVSDAKQQLLLQIELSGVIDDSSNLIYIRVWRAYKILAFTYIEHLKVALKLYSVSGIKTQF